MNRSCLDHGKKEMNKFQVVYRVYKNSGIRHAKYTISVAAIDFWHYTRITNVYKLSKTLLQPPLTVKSLHTKAFVLFFFNSHSVNITSVYVIHFRCDWNTWPSVQNVQTRWVIRAEHTNICTTGMKSYLYSAAWACVYSCLHRLGLKLYTEVIVAP